MKIINQYIVSKSSKWVVLYETKYAYFITTNGAFGQRETYVEQIDGQEARRLIEEMAQPVVPNNP